MFLFLYFPIPFVFLKCLCSSNVSWLHVFIYVFPVTIIYKKKKSYPESYYKPFLEYQKIIAIAK